MEFDGHKLKAKAFVLRCRSDHNNVRYSAQYTWSNPAFANFLKCIKEIGAEVVDNLTQEEVRDEVETREFYGYSTLMFIFYLNCPCDSGYYVNRLHKSLQANERLRLITKIVLDYSFAFGCARGYEAVWEKGVISFTWENDILLNGEFSSKTNELREIKKHTIMSSSTYYLPKADNFVFIACKVTGKYYNKSALDPQGYEEYEEEDEDIFYDDVDSAFSENEEDDEDFTDEEELTFIHDTEYEDLWKTENIPKGDKLFFHIIIERLSQYAQKKSIQAICMDVREDIENLKITEKVFFETTSTEGCYFFNINPALYIVINHMTFQTLQMRKGAEKDIKAFKKLCRLHRIPHLIIEDGSAEQVQKLMHLIQTTNLSLLKNLFICIMSHGDQGDIIYTKTSSYTVDDIKGALHKNQSLRDVETLLFLNICRGDFDPRYDERPQPLEPTIASDLDDSTVVLYSTRKGCVSLRSESNGSLAVQKFTQAFEKCIQTFSLRKLHAEMENDLLEENFDFDAMTELCSRQGVDHIVTMEFRNFVDFMELYQKFEMAAASSK